MPLNTPLDRARILFLGNWPLEGKGEGRRYAFFAQWKSSPAIRLMGTFRLGPVTRFEKSVLRFYLLAPLVAFFRSFRSDIVIAYSAQVGLPLALFFRLAHRRHVKLIVFDVESMGRVTRGWPLALARFAAARFDRVVYASSRQIEYYRKYFPALESKCVFIPIGIGKYEKRVPLGTPGTGPIVAPGHHGRAFRDWATLLAAYAPLSQRAELLIVGRESVPEEDRGGVPIPPNVRFEPFLPIEEFQSRIENAPFVVLPLPERGQSLGQLTVLFCMAMGKAVIGTRVMGIEDYVEDGVTGLFTTPGDVGDMTRAIARFLDHPDEAAAMGGHALENYRMLFTDAVMGAAWERVVEEVVGRKLETDNRSAGGR